MPDWSSSEDEADACPTDVDDIQTKVWNGFGELPNFIMTDDVYGLFKLAWEAKGYTVIKA